MREFLILYVCYTIIITLLSIICRCIPRFTAIMLGDKSNIRKVALPFILVPSIAEVPAVLLKTMLSLVITLCAWGMDKNVSYTDYFEYIMGEEEGA